MEASVDLKGQAETSVEANSGYNDPASATTLQRVPQLPDPEVALHQSVTQGGSRPVPDDQYEGVDIQDDGSRRGEGASDPVEAARQNADSAEPGASDSDDGPTLKELQERAAELDISGRSSMNKEQLAAAIADAEAGA